MSRLPRAVCPVEHIFTPGLYTRRTTLPAGSLVTSMEHKTEHPFVVAKGTVEVITPEGAFIYQAPHSGITMPGTRRVLRALTETVWFTFHVTEKTDVEAIASDILEPHANPLLPAGAGNEWRHESPKLPSAP